MHVNLTQWYVVRDNFLTQYCCVKIASFDMVHWAIFDSTFLSCRPDPRETRAEKYVWVIATQTFKSISKTL